MTDFTCKNCMHFAKDGGVFHTHTEYNYSTFEEYISCRVPNRILSHNLKACSQFKPKDQKTCNQCKYYTLQNICDHPNNYFYDLDAHKAGVTIRQMPAHYYCSGFILKKINLPSILCANCITYDYNSDRCVNTESVMYNCKVDCQHNCKLHKFARQEVKSPRRQLLLPHRITSYSY